MANKSSDQINRPARLVSIEWDRMIWIDTPQTQTQIRAHARTYITRFYEQEDTLNRKITVFQFIKFHSIYWTHRVHVCVCAFAFDPLFNAACQFYAVCIDDGTQRFGGFERCHYWVHDVVWMSTTEYATQLWHIMHDIPSFRSYRCGDWF